MANERRAIADQRSSPTKPVSPFSFGGQREKTRRSGEDRDYYVDRYEPRYLVMVSLILILCVLDAYFTLRILELGGREMNRFMLVLLYKKPILTLMLKYVVTAFGVIFILVHKNFVIFGRLKVHGLIYVIFSVYFILVVYEAATLFKPTRAFFR